MIFRSGFQLEVIRVCFGLTTVAFFESFFTREELIPPKSLSPPETDPGASVEFEVESLTGDPFFVGGRVVASDGRSRAWHMSRCITC